jgi:hypothetical protein
LPAPQSVHLFSVAPVVPMKVPPLHAEQLPWPARAWKDPTVQMTQALAATAAY